MAPLTLEISFIPDPHIPTAATSEAGITYYNPAYISRLDPKEVVKTLYHEVLHLFLDYFGRRSGRDNFQWNVAHDLEIAAEVRPAGCITPEIFQLPKGKLGEWYYDMLPEKSKSPCSHHLVSGRDQLSTEIRNAIIHAADKVIEAPAGENGPSPSLRQHALRIVAPSRGNDILRRIQGALAVAGDSDFSYGRPNRRHGAREGPMMPAMIHREARVMAVLDVSGSMGARTEPATRALLGAVQCVGSGLDVVAWDTQPQSLYHVRTGRDLEKLNYSGGGTDMAAAIRYCAARARYDAIFVITDCGTEWPAEHEARRFPPVYILRVGSDGEGPPWARTIQAD